LNPTAERFLLDVRGYLQRVKRNVSSQVEIANSLTRSPDRIIRTFYHHPILHLDYSIGLYGGFGFNDRGMTDQGASAQQRSPGIKQNVTMGALKIGFSVRLI
jgi:hypothetical protein